MKLEVHGCGWLISNLEFLSDFGDKMYNQIVTLLDFLSFIEIYLSDLNVNLLCATSKIHNHADQGSVLHWDFVPQIIARCLEFDCPLFSFILISCRHIRILWLEVKRKLLLAFGDAYFYENIENSQVKAIVIMGVSGDGKS
ncbi:hypothetical protein NC653_041154 [Populus alba x Populus x berolinensis]|uniref:Uncharacterized protein n=1 Tax=Populus alba x Populus x berolinensis TaxID=444605 RepID=A0AAD6L7R4_9ROSI|nr:hypothetical protein NC653_041154 [Populus alba x Populus x berolinensis]